jgi:tetratricopeptide (TPR) repeat protein
MGMVGSLSTLIEESYAVERSGQISAAFRHAREAVNQARASGEAEAIAAALNCLAFFHFRLGHYDQASLLSQEALSHAASDSAACADALLMLGMCATETDDLAAGEALYHRTIDLSRQLGSARTLFRGLHNLSAGVYMPRGQFELALAADEEALHLATEHGMPELAWAPSLTIAWVYWLTGRLSQAYQALDALQQVALPGSVAEGYYYCVLGNLALDEGTPDRAPPLYARTRSIAEVVGAPDLNVWVRLGLSRYHCTIGDPSGGQAWANDAWTVAARVCYRHMQGIALVERGRAAWQGGDSAKAEADLRAAIDILDLLGTVFDLARARLLLAAFLQESKHQEAAAAWESAARAILDGGFSFLLQQERALAFPLTAEYLASADPALATVSASCVEHLQRVPPPPLHVVTHGGDLLPECLYAEWTVVPRERLCSLYERALLKRAGIRFGSACYQEVLDDCGRVLEIEPWREQAVLLGMRAALALNDFARARRLYRDLEKTLREELNAAPQEELQTLFRSLAKPVRTRPAN